MKQSEVSSPPSEETSTAATSPDDSSWSAYKRIQVRCKQAAIQDIGAIPGFVDVLCSEDERIYRLQCDHDYYCDSSEFYQGPMFGIVGFPGFVFFPQAISTNVQTELVYQSVSEFCEAPHATNIDLLSPKSYEIVNTPNETMWKLWKQQTNATTDSSNQKEKFYRSFQKLSWATTGYHYDWTQRAYHEGAKSPMPATLKNISTLLARTALAMEHTATAKDSTADCTAPIKNRKQKMQFTPSACIINYYHNKSVMGGHRDDLEYALDKPVVSMSLGLPGIFLLGGATKQDSPVLPILARPGDVMVLGGASRLNFHGMARVLPRDSLTGLAAVLPPGASDRIPTTTQQVTSAKCSPNIGQVHTSFHYPETDDEAALELFLRTHRINITVRQVHKDKG